jgi:hypothetical protein
MMFLDCPAYLDRECTARCGLPAEIRCRFTMRSTDGPIESAIIRCPVNHHFCGAIESLTWEDKDEHDACNSVLTSRVLGGRTVQGIDDGRDGTGTSAVRGLSAGPKADGSRPNTAPAYYLGRPASLWITALRTTRGHPMSAVTGSRTLLASRRGAASPMPALAARPVVG